MFGIAVELEPELADGLDADVDRAILGIRRLERRQPPQPADVGTRRKLCTVGAEQPLEPALAQPRVRVVDRVGRPVENGLELAQRDLLVGLVARDRVSLARERALEIVAGDEQSPPLVVEARTELLDQRRRALRAARSPPGRRASPLRRSAAAPRRRTSGAPRGARSRARPRRRRAPRRRCRPRRSCAADRGALARPGRSPSSSASRSDSSCGWVKRSACRATMAACSDVSFSPTRTARTSSAALDVVRL